MSWIRDAALLLILTTVPAVGQTARVFYDTVENGQLTGGRVTLDLADPAIRAEFGADLPVGFRMGGWPVTTIRDNGPTGNRIDVVMLGDGYTAGQLGNYATHVSNVVNPFFAQEPLAAYANYFNVHRVDVTSIDSGVDEIDLNIFKNTALDMAYGCFGIDRLLCINVSKAAAAASSAPDVDQILALANSTRYGGAGYSGNNLGTLAGNNSLALEIALHEFGHSFADLADEYDYADGATYAGGEYIDANVSIFDAAEIAAQQTKWFRWLNLVAVDAFEGAAYYQFGVFRPTLNSKMRSLSRPFQEVNVEQFVMYMYYSVLPVDDASPESPEPLAPCDPLFVVPMQPIGHSLSVQWFIDGKPAAGATGNEFTPADANLPPGQYQVSVRVVDPTNRVRDEDFREAFMTFTRTWPVTVTANDAVCACSQLAVGQEESAVEKNRYITFDPSILGGEFALRVRLVDLLSPAPPNVGPPPPDYSSIEGQFRWVGPPQLVAEQSGSPATLYAAALQCAPFYFDWSAIAELHVTGAEVAPSSSYEIQAVGSVCNASSESEFGPPLMVTTGRWGDVAAPFQDSEGSVTQPNVIDIGVMVDKLKALPAALSRPRVQLQPAAVNVATGITIQDVGLVVDAVKGFPFPYAAPEPCPP